MWMQQCYDLFRNNYFHVSYRHHMPCMLICQLVSLGYACKSRKMSALLNSVFFAFKISFLPKYSVKYYDYIVKWCSGV